MHRGKHITLTVPPRVVKAGEASASVYDSASPRGETPGSRSGGDVSLGPIFLESPFVASRLTFHIPPFSLVQISLLRLTPWQISGCGSQHPDYSRLNIPKYSKSGAAKSNSYSCFRAADSSPERPRIAGKGNLLATKKICR